MEKEPMDTPVVRGAFVESLKRTNKQVKDERADIIAEDAETAYRREIEDMKAEYKRLLRNQRTTLDLSPENTQSLVMAKDFNGKEFAKMDITSGIRLRNLKVKIEIAEERYAYLFGGDVEDAKPVGTVTVIEA